MRLRYPFKRGVVLSVVLISLLSWTDKPAAAQTTSPISYGQTVSGEIKNNTTDYAQFYQLTAPSNDKISLILKRTSGNLVSVLGLIDPTLPQNNQLLTIGRLSGDNKTNS